MWKASDGVTPEWSWDVGGGSHYLAWMVNVASGLKWWVSVFGEEREKVPKVRFDSVLEVKSLSRVRLFATPWTVAHQAPPSMGFSGKNTGVGCHFLLLRFL